MPMIVLLAAVAIPSESTMLAVGALLATFVAGLFARSILEHELDLFRRARLGQDVTRRNRLGVTRPLDELSANYHESVSNSMMRPFAPVTRADLLRQDDDRQARALLDGGPTEVIPAWPTRL